MNLYTTTPPISRKKTVSGRYNPDTFRVISNDAETREPRFSDRTIYQNTFLDTPSKGPPAPYTPQRDTEVLPAGTRDYRANRPHPGACTFLREDVLLLNDPICSVNTHHTREEQNNWWPSSTTEEPLSKPTYTLDTTFRDDYRPLQVDPGISRHECNPNNEPVLGTVPVNILRARNGNQRFWKEGISFEHQFNCRQDPSYPIRGKRHGSLVWTELDNQTRQKFIDEQTDQLTTGTTEAEHLPSVPSSRKASEVSVVKEMSSEIDTADAFVVDDEAMGTTSSPKSLSEICVKPCEKNDKLERSNS